MVEKTLIRALLFIFILSGLVVVLNGDSSFEWNDGNSSGEKNEEMVVEDFLVSESEEPAIDLIAPTIPDQTQSSDQAQSSQEEVALLDQLYRVVSIVDGDTVVINKDGKDESVRMIGIDTPETVHPTKVVECFGKEASLKTKEWLEGRKVYLVVDEGEGERDRYRRLLGYVFRDDGFFVNLELIRQGYAFEYTYDLPYKYQKEFIDAENDVRKAKRGLWEDGVCL